MKIPGLSLQPLLENAIYHGIQQLPDGGTVTIRAGYQQGVVSLEVINPIVAAKGSAVQGNRLAHGNIHHRLQALYGPKAALTTQVNDGQFHALMRYPAAVEA